LTKRKKEIDPKKAKNAPVGYAVASTAIKVIKKNMPEFINEKIVKVIIQNILYPTEVDFFISTSKER